MMIEETWSISGERITEFLLAQDDVRLVGDSCFSFRQCKIYLKVLPQRVVGSLGFPQTQISFYGSEQDTEVIYRRFVFQFISAGA